jgi:signal transduction histidine kinase
MDSLDQKRPAAPKKMTAPNEASANIRPTPDTLPDDDRISAILDAVSTLGENLVAGTDTATTDGRVSLRHLAEVAATADMHVASVESAIRRYALRHPRLFGLPPTTAIESVLRILVSSSAPVTDASVWMWSAERKLRCVASVGREPTRRIREVAAAALGTGETAREGAGPIFAVPVVRWEQRAAALVIRAASPARADARAAAEDAAATLSHLLERAALLERNATNDQSSAARAERRLARLTFDMHDGPLQDVVALLSDVRLYRRQLMQTLSGAPNAGILIGRIDDFEARLIAIDDELRKLAQSFESPSLLERPYEEVLEAELQLTRNVGIRTECDLRIDPETMTASQRIATLRIVQEALANVRDHSGATSAKVSVIDETTHFAVAVSDDGCGFAVEETLVSAGRRGRLGLVGMAERVRMLGGTFDIQSAPYRGTVIAVALPHWQPLAGDEEAGMRSHLDLSPRDA